MRKPVVALLAGLSIAWSALSQARNVILFIGDGMGLLSPDAAGIYVSRSQFL
jgi:alkaline phosphatase